MRRRGALAPDGAASQSPEERLLEREKRHMVRRAILGLPPRQRMAIVLQRYHGLRYQEIAHIMDCSTGAVESLLSRAVDQLGRALGEYISVTASSGEGFPRR